MPTTIAPTQIAGEAVDEVWRRPVVAGAREDRREHRDAEDTAELAQGVVRAGRLALFLPAAPRRGRRSRPGEEETHPDARDDERAEEARVGDVGVDDRRHPSERDRLQREPARHERPAADPVRERRRPGPRTSSSPSTASMRRPAPKRRVALSGLQELGQQEDRAEHAEVHRDRRAVRGRERPACGRSGAAASAPSRGPPTRRRRRAGRGRRRSSRPPRAAPAERVPSDDAPDDAEQADR